MSSSPPIWVRRLADIPGVGYSPPMELDVSRLKYRDHQPTIERSSYDGSDRLDWPERDGEWTSESPARARGDALYGEDLTAEQVRQILAEVLELPGEPSDYHFMIGSAADQLEALARRDPSLLAEAERLHWLDVRLVQAREDIIREPAASDGWLRVGSFDRLVRIYEQAGFLPEALEVALIAERYGQAYDRVEKLRERIANEEPADGV